MYIRASSYPAQHQYPQGGGGGAGPMGVVHQAASYHQHMGYRHAGSPFTSQRPQRLPIDMAGEGVMDPHSSVYMYRQPPPRYPYSAQTSPVQSPHGQVGGVGNGGHFSSARVVSGHVIWVKNGVFLHLCVFLLRTEPLFVVNSGCNVCTYVCLYSSLVSQQSLCRGSHSCTQSCKPRPWHSQHAESPALWVCSHTH